MVWRFLKKLKIELPYNPTIPLLGIFISNIIYIISNIKLFVDIMDIIRYMHFSVQSNLTHDR